ncbi:MAG TPA: hypothetical protein VFO40_22655 [Chthoniobacterales bacterium]|nr:hypothetical protein [Chthoniobacterales bacterium]
MEVIIAQRRQNSAVLTYSENGAKFPNHGMGSPFCKPNEKIQDEGCKKKTHLTKKKDDFGNALQNLYRELERAENVVGPS